MTSNIGYRHWAVKKIISHGVWWAFYIIYELSIFYFTTGSLSGIGKSLLFYVLNICLFYCHYAILRSTLTPVPRKYVQLITYAIATLCLFVALKSALGLLYTYSQQPHFDNWNQVRKLAALDLYRSIFFMGLSSLYWAGSNISNYERKAKESAIKQLTAERDALALQTSLARSENALLRQKINPHLIFNTLNFIHSTVYKVSGCGGNGYPAVGYIAVLDGGTGR
jgi:two-component system LytT family sensor kinase